MSSWHSREACIARTGQVVTLTVGHHPIGKNNGMVREMQNIGCNALQQRYHVVVYRQQ